MWVYGVDIPRLAPCGLRSSRSWTCLCHLTHNVDIDRCYLSRATCLRWVLAAGPGFLYSWQAGAMLSLQRAGSSLQWLPCCRAQSLRRLGSVVWCLGLVVLQHVDSSQTRD